MLNYGSLEDIPRHVEFVSYTGKYPTLCAGILTLKIDGQEVKFGYKMEGKNNEYYRPFWQSGGDINHYEPHTGEWEIRVEDIPEQYRQYAAEIDNIFNKNVEHGCCGGCI